MERKEKVSKKFLIVTALYENDLNCPTVLFDQFLQSVGPLADDLRVRELRGRIFKLFAHLFDESLIRTCTFLVHKNPFTFTLSLFSHF